MIRQEATAIEGPREISTVDHQGVVVFWHKAVEPKTPVSQSFGMWKNTQRTLTDNLRPQAGVVTYNRHIDISRVTLFLKVNDRGFCGVVGREEIDEAVWKIALVYTHAMQCGDVLVV